MRKERKNSRKRKRTITIYVADLKMKSLFSKTFFNFRTAQKSVSKTGTRGGPGPHGPIRGRFSFDPPC